MNFNTSHKSLDFGPVWTQIVYMVQHEIEHAQNFAHQPNLKLIPDLAKFFCSQKSGLKQLYCITTGSEEEWCTSRGEDG